MLSKYKKIIKTKYRKFKKARLAAKPIAEYVYGGQDIVDLISYAGLEETPSHLVLDGKYIRTIFVSGFPFVATTGWLTNLINFNHNIDISYHIESIDPQLAVPKLARKITELESRRRSLTQQGKIVGSEILDPLESATNLKESILRGQEKLFQVSIYSTIFADSLEDLEKITTLLEISLSAKLFYTKTAVYEQIPAFQSVLPRGENLLAQKRNLDSSSAALTFPFVSSELVHESGILYGVNKSNNSLVILDRFSLHNANSITFAQSGSGKSYTAKVEILRHLMQGTRVIVIDPEREYKLLSESLKGSYIKLSAKSQEKINPFDFSTSTFGVENSLTEQIQDLTEFISLLCGGLSTEDRSIVDRLLIKTYKQFGWKEGKTPKILKYPVLSDFYKNLKAEGYKKLASKLEIYTKGSLASVFNSQTTVNLDNRLVVFDIKELPESLRQIMLMVVANYVYNQVKKSPQKRMLVVDEGWLLLEHEESARFIAGLTRRARKYFLGVNIITQQANDFLNNTYGRAIASQASLRILMRQDTTTIKKVVDEFSLSEYEEKFLLTCEKGEALIIADQNHVAIKVVASDEEHPLITTDPHETFKKV